MNLTSTFWTVPFLNGRWNQSKAYAIKHNLMLAALSVSWAKKSGAHITMHCDNCVYDILNQFGYDNVYNDLNELKPAYVSPTIVWAAGKIVSLESEPLGTIHIDNDVLIKSPKTLEAMNFDEYDFIFQHVEKESYAIQEEIFKDTIQTVELGHDFHACVGILGFNNQELLNKYVAHYKYYLDNLNVEKTDNYLNADLLLEQCYLYDRMKEYKYKTLIGDLREEEELCLQIRSKNMGFEHYMGPTKFVPHILKRLYDELNKINPTLYNMVQSIEIHENNS